MTCEEFNRIEKIGLNHEPDFKDSYFDLSEDERMDLTASEERDYFIDPMKEDDFLTSIRRKKGDHLKTCTNQECQKIRQNWLSHDELSLFVN